MAWLYRSMRVTVRIAGPDDAPEIAEAIAVGFESYRAWAPPDWTPPVADAAARERLAAALGRADVWCLLAVDRDEVAGHVALAAVTVEDPEPAPPGVTNLWQLFVRPSWQGRGVAPALMAAAVQEARRRGFARLRLWTPRGAARARRFYERQGWAPTGRVHEHSPSGLPTLEYGRLVSSERPASSRGSR